MNVLASKAAVATSGAVGIGRACVQRMSEEGAALAEVLSTEGREAILQHADVTDAAAKRFGRLYLMVNNAVVSGAPKPHHEATAEERDRSQAVDVKGLSLGAGTRSFILHPSAVGGGSIVNHSSLAGLIVDGGYTAR